MSSNQSRKSPTAQNRGLEGANYLYAVRDAIGLSGAEKCVAMILVSHRNHKTGQCNLSYDTMAVKSGFKRRTVINAIKSLCAKGLVGIEARRTSAGDRTSNQYEFHIDSWFLFSSSGVGGAPDAPGSAPNAPRNEKRGAPDALGSAPNAPGSAPDALGGVHQMHSKLGFRSSIEVTSEDKGVFSVSKNKAETRKGPSQAEIGQAVAFYGLRPEFVKRLVEEFVADVESQRPWNAYVAERAADAGSDDLYNGECQRGSKYNARSPLLS